jgi:putative ABC transport system permease protein
MILIRGTFRGVRRRAGVSIGILLVATVAAAAASTGPAYDAAARQSIFQDNVRAPSSPTDVTVEVTDSGPVAGLASNLDSQVTGVLADHLGGTATMHRLFQPPVELILAQVTTGTHLTPLTWHTGECAHLPIVSGSCPESAGQVLVSTSFARMSHVRPGDTIGSSSGYGRFTVTGEYTVPPIQQLDTPYWLVGPCDDFAYEDPCGGNPNSATSGVRYDAMFTTAATFAGAPPSAQGQAAVLDVLAPAGLRAGDLGPLTAAVNELLTDQGLQGLNATMNSSIPQLTAQISTAWRTLDVPVFLITCQVLLLAWLLLFLIAVDAAEARADEIALAKLRGHGRFRTIAFGLSEPVVLLAAGFPAGVLAGWGATVGLTRILLRPGTPVSLTVLAVAAGAAATLGGFVAIVLAARRALVRPVTLQWQHTARGGPDRGWVLDAVLLTGALAGLAELLIGGNVTSARSGSLGLLVPGLLGLAAAVVTSRLLPAACGFAASISRRRGGTALFLAVRHIARRPGGTRTTIVLTAAFALATFAVAAFAVDQRNVDRVAAAQTGAPAVLTVTAPAGQDLGTIVDRVDPGGNQAAAVDRFEGDTATSAVLLAVQPQRFARVAAWQSGFVNRPPSSLAAALQPPAAPAVTLPAGSAAMRVQVTGQSGVPRGADLTIWVNEEGSPDSGQSPVSFGALHEGMLSGTVTGCPCRVAMVSIDAPAGSFQGGITLSGLEVQNGTRWEPVPVALASATGWSAGAEIPSGCTGTTGQLQDEPGGLRWSFTSTESCSPALHRQDVPYPLPAVISNQVTGSLNNFATVGLDGLQLVVRPFTLAAAVPGAPATGILVDRTYAQRDASYADASNVSEQVWVAQGSLDAIRAKLVAAGVKVDGVAVASSAASVLMRQGPALASVLFLATAVAAVLLAAGAAVLSLYQAGRRRRYEYAALVAGRVPRRSLRTSVLIEQATVLGFGAVMGVLAGLGAGALVLRNLPVFVTSPTAPPLLYTPPATQILIWLVIAVAVLAIPATVAAVALIRSVRPELLREVAA